VRSIPFIFVPRSHGLNQNSPPLIDRLSVNVTRGDEQRKQDSIRNLFIGYLSEPPVFMRTRIEIARVL